MPEWIIDIAPITQALSMIVLVGVTVWYAHSVKRQVDLVERQAKEHEARQRERTAEAIRTIIAELEINSQEGGWKQRQSPPLLDSAYGANLWAVHLIGMGVPTFRALGDAYLNIKRYDLLYGAVAEARQYGDAPDKGGACRTAWDDAQEAIATALKALRDDPSTRRFAAVEAGEGSQ